MGDGLLKPAYLLKDVHEAPTKGVNRYSTSTGGFSPKTVRFRSPKRIILRSRSFITFEDRPGQARRKALGRW